MTRVAALDIGTNTARMLVADVAGPGLLQPRVAWLDHRSTVTHLGQAVDRTGELQTEAIDRTVAVLRRYGDAIRSWECEAVRAVATSATRDAANRDVFLDRAELAIGARPEVIDGAAEAALSFAGSTGGLDAPPPFLVVDPGGGSTEFVAGHDVPDRVVSVDIGSVRLTERALPDKPATVAQLAAARHHVDELLATHVSIAAGGATVVGVGGTYTALAAIHRGLEVYDSDVVHGTEVSLAALHELADRLATLTLAEIAAIPSLDPARAPVLLGGAVVAERALRHLGAGAITVSERDILDGIAVSLVTS